MGNQCGQVALHMSTSGVFVTDIEQSNVVLAEERGPIGIDATEEDPVDRIRPETDSISTDVIFETRDGQLSRKRRLVMYQCRASATFEQGCIGYRTRRH